MQSFLSNTVDLISVRLAVTFFYYYIVLFYTKFDLLLHFFPLTSAAVKEGVECCLIEVIFAFKLMFNTNKDLEVNVFDNDSLETN